MLVIVRCDTCIELESMCVPTVYEIMKKLNRFVPFLVHVSTKSVVIL